MQRILSKNEIPVVKPLSNARSATVFSQASARLSFAGAAVFLFLLALLHIVKPEFDPSWRFVSEYAIGRHGWIMVLAFISLAFSCLTSAIAIRSQIEAMGGRIGLALLVVVAATLILAGVFVADPIMVTQDELTTHGTIHGLAATIGIPGLPIAAVLISHSLLRKPAWSSARLSLLFTAHLTWVTVLGMFVSMFIMLGRNQGKFGPEVLIGWPNRLVVLAYCLWLMVVAWQVVKKDREANS